MSMCTRSRASRLVASSGMTDMDTMRVGHAEELDELLDLDDDLRAEGAESDDATGVDGLPAWRQGYP